MNPVTDAEIAYLRSREAVLADMVVAYQKLIKRVQELELELFEAKKALGLTRSA